MTRKCPISVYVHKRVCVYVYKSVDVNLRIVWFESDGHMGREIPKGGQVGVIRA